MTTSKKTLLGIFVILVLSLVVFRWYEFFAGAAVKQPLKFSHKVHAEAAKCDDCHTSVEKAASAGLPDISVCMGCHEGGPVTDSPEEKKLMTYIKAKTEIGWVRLNRIPFMSISPMPDMCRWANWHARGVTGIWQKRRSHRAGPWLALIWTTA